MGESQATDIARAKELNIVHCLGGFYLFINLWAAWEVLWVVWAWRILRDYSHDTVSHMMTG